MDDAPAFHDESPPVIEDYAPMSGLAIVAFILALLTPITLIAASLTLLCVVPIVVAGVASWRIFKADQPIKGRNLAILAIMIPTLIASWSISANSLARRHLASEGRRAIEQWLDLLAEGKLYEAHELHRQYADRQFPSVDLGYIYNKEFEEGVAMTPDEIENRMAIMQNMQFTPKEELEFFFDHDPMKTVADHARDAEFRFVRVEDVKWGSPDTSLQLRYEMSFRDGGVRRRQNVIFELTRSLYEQGEYQWSVFGALAPRDDQ